MNNISVELKHGIYEPKAIEIRTRSEHGRVLMLINGSVLDFSTIAAHKAGFALVKKKTEANKGDYIVLKINNQNIDLLPMHAQKVGVALLRKADDADEYQLRMVK